MRIVSWNVNGLRACLKKGFLDVLEDSGADVMLLQEVRAFPEQLPPPGRSPEGWHTAFAPAERPGYSGVAVYSRRKPDRIERSLGDARFDVEGRFIVAHFGRMAIASVYFPKGSGRERDNSRVPYKLDFYAAVFERISQLRRRGPVFVAGDYNTAVEAIDLARPKTNTKSSGFLPEEREEMRR
ncbi:MAG: exodeoxyribonuclease III, partial [Pseudomonadota bacterium]